LTFSYPIYSNWPCNIFESLLADVLEHEVNFARCVLLNARRDADSPGRGQALEPDRNINAIAKDVAVLDYNVAHVDAQPELEALVHRCRRVPLGHVSLKFGGAAQRFHDTAELDEEPVTGRLDKPAVVRRDSRIE
jgi:hypothetical protein